MSRQDGDNLARYDTDGSMLISCWYFWRALRYVEITGVNRGNGRRNWRRVTRGRVDTDATLVSMSWCAETILKVSFAGIILAWSLRGADYKENINNSLPNRS